GNHRMLKSGHHPAKFYEEMWATILRGGVWSGEIVNRRKDGSEYDAHLTTGPVRDRQGKLEGFVSIQRDITDRKRAAMELERSNIELERKNKEMEQFVYTVSHDLKSPLVTIQGFAGHMARDMKDGRSDRIEGYLQRIHKSSVRMARLIDDLLDLSRIGRITHATEPVDLNVLIRELEERHEDHLQSQRITLDGMPLILADRERIAEVFDNLLTNAIKYGCDGEDARIKIGAVEETGEIRIFVRDHGPGIPPEYHDTVFQLFHRLDQSAEGTGVGLSIVKRIVEVHGGRVWIESECAEGATFWVALPRKRARVEDAVVV
ncbi:MAG: ATP-binding protein, partial [Phycisphaerae bacterium]